MPVTTQTFYDLWMSIRLYVPNAPVFLIQRWTRNAFRQLADRRIWSWRLLQGQLVWADARDVDDVTATFGSPIITKVGAFSAADLGRNFRIGTYPIYTIIDVPDADNLTLDRDYEGATQGTLDQDSQILDAYAVLPASFEQFVMIVDPVNQRLVPWWATQEEMTRIDPIRQAAGSVPRLLGSASPSVVPATLGHVQYEYYPKPTARGALQYYAKALPTYVDSDVIPGMLGARIDVLESAILAQAARWPGTEVVKNPYFNLQLANQLTLDFERLANQLDIRDDDVYQQSYDKTPWQKFNSWAWAYDCNLLQMTDASLADYAGFGGSWGGGYGYGY